MTSVGTWEPPGQDWPKTDISGSYPGRGSSIKERSDNTALRWWWWWWWWWYTVYSSISICINIDVCPDQHMKTKYPNCGTTAATSPHRLTLFIKLFHAVNFSPSTVRPGALYTFSRHGGNTGRSILLLSTVDPIGTGGHRDPDSGTLPGETGHQSVIVDFPFLFSLLSFSYFIILLFDFPLSFPFSFGVL